MAGRQSVAKSEKQTTKAEETPKLYWPIDNLYEWQDNPRAIKPEDFDRLKKQIIELGEYKPLLITPEGEVIGGNMRFKAYRELGYKKAWVSVVTPKDHQEKLRYALSDNDSAGYYIKDFLSTLIEPYKENVDFLSEFKVDFNVGSDLNALLKDLEVKEEFEEEDEPPVKPESKLGEAYQLGRHRVMCGDATDESAVALLMDGQKVDISFTSPPYNAGTTPTENDMGMEGKYEDYNDEKSDEEYLKLLVDSTVLSLKYASYSFVNLQSISGNKVPLIDFLYAMKSQYADTIIWDKIDSQPALAQNVLNSEFEYIHVFSERATRAIGTKKYRGTLKNIVHITRRKGNDIKNHHATFPIDFAKHFVFNFSSDNGSVLDLFGGTGTTLIACHQLNRTCYMMELNPAYVDLIRKRYAKFIGKESEWLEITKAT